MCWFDLTGILFVKIYSWCLLLKNSYSIVVNSIRYYMEVVLLPERKVWCQQVFTYNFIGI